MIEALVKKIPSPWFFVFSVVHIFIFLIVFKTGIYTGLFDHDFAVQYYYASDILDLGRLPYRDFPVEYPPLGLLFFVIPGLFTDTLASYNDVFTLQILFFDIGIILILAALSKKIDLNPWKTLGIYTLALLAVGSIVTVRYDLIAAFFVMLSLYAFISGKFKTAWVILALGVMTKIFPIVLAPIYLIYHWRKGQLRQIFTGGGAFAVTLGVIAIVPLLISAGGFIESFTYHADRPLQIESLYSSVLLVAQSLGFSQFSFSHSFGSTNVISPIADLFKSASFIIVGISLLLVYWLFNRYQNKVNKFAQSKESVDQTTVHGIIVFATLAILIFIIFNKVLSPQFIIWLLPLIPLLYRDNRMIWLLFVLIGFTTAFFYPRYYPGLEEGHGVVVGMLVLRNILLAVLLGMTLNKARKMTSVA